MIKIVRSIVDHVYKDRRILALVIFINIIGSLFGLYYYWEQLSVTPWYYWIFVPDCPLYTFLMIFALIFLIAGKRYDTFNTITAVGLAMYGTWTMVILLYFNEIYFAPANALMSTGLFVSHFGMALESVLLMPYLKKVGIISWLIAWAWFFIQTVFDYFVPYIHNGLTMRLHPLALVEYYSQGYPGFTVLTVKLDMVMYLTFAMTIIYVVTVYVLAKTWDVAIKDTSKVAKESADQAE